MYQCSENKMKWVFKRIRLKVHRFQTWSAVTCQVFSANTRWLLHNFCIRYWVITGKTLTRSVHTTKCKTVLQNGSIKFCYLKPKGWFVRMKQSSMTCLTLLITVYCRWDIYLFLLGKSVLTASLVMIEIKTSHLCSVIFYESLQLCSHC